MIHSQRYAAMSQESQIGCPNIVCDSSSLALFDLWKMQGTQPGGPLLSALPWCLETITTGQTVTAQYVTRPTDASVVARR